MGHKPTCRLAKVPFVIPSLSEPHFDSRLACSGEKGMFSIHIRELLLLIAEATALGLIPAVLAAQTGRGFVRWWIYGSLLSLAVRVIFIIAGWLLSYVLWTPRA